ncbi:MAG: hypothetical protein CG438_209 [Methylococcaceae bacterium NSP1-1]|nr:MAG: hypothetical protein CG438_209 [Methylococcaceae bacterium NSP1-1]
MKSETATQGKITKMVFGADAIEIKATIPDAHIEHTLSRFNLTLDNDEERYIYFFDTPSLDLLKAGIIARTRRIVGEEHERPHDTTPGITEEDIKTQFQWFQDRGRRQRKRNRQICILYHAGEKGPDQSCCRWREVNRKTVHQRPGRFSCRNGELSDRLLGISDTWTAKGQPLEIRRPGQSMEDHCRAMAT